MGENVRGQIEKIARVRQSPGIRIVAGRLVIVGTFVKYSGVHV